MSAAQHRRYTSATRTLQCDSRGSPSMPTKTCYRCGVERPLAPFIAKKNSTFHDMCSPCLSAILARQQSTSRARLTHIATSRTCYLSHRGLAPTEFTRRSNGTYFLACRDCTVNVFTHRRLGRMLAAEGSFTTDELLNVLGRFPACPSAVGRGPPAGGGRRVSNPPGSQPGRVTRCGKRWSRSVCIGRARPVRPARRARRCCGRP